MKKFGKKKFITAIIIIGLCIINFSYLKSLSVMTLYDIYQNSHSIMKENGLKIKIPGGLKTLKKDWYPFVMTFNDDSIKASLKEDIKLTVLYNFGAFKKGISTFYDRQSDYFSSFYGAYIIESNKTSSPYGYEGGTINTDKIVKLARHDIDTLVLASLGCKNSQTQFLTTRDLEETDYVNYSDWTKIDSAVYTRSPLHKYKENHQAYIQYGKPPSTYKDTDFEEVKLYSRIYCRYFEQDNVTIILYIIAPNFDIINETDSKLLSKTKIGY